MNRPVPQFAVVICAYTMARWDELCEAVASVQQQTYAAKEIVLVIDGNEELYERARTTFPTLSVVRNRYGQGLSGARNTGIAHATADTIAFLDDDASASTDWLEQLAHVYATTDAEAVGGQIAPIWPNGRPGWFPSEFDWVVGCTYVGMPTTLAPVRNLIGCNMSIAAESLTRVGWFRTGRVGALSIGQENDETDLCIRLREQSAGDVIYYQPLAAVAHHVSANRTSIRYFIKRCFSEGVSKARLRHTLPFRSTLSTETSYTLSTLPSGIGRSIWHTIRGIDPSGLFRAIAIVGGFAATLSGYMVGFIVHPVPHLTPAQDIAGNAYESDNR